MNTVAKLIGFAAGLVLVFGAAAVAGGAFDPAPPRSAAAERAMGAGATDAMGAHTDRAMDAESGTAMQVRGLSVADKGLRLAVADEAFARGQAKPLRFRIVDENGVVVRDFDVEHTKRMHLIVVRRDLTNFQHLHPVQQPDGSWTTPLRLDTAGSYRIFADFSHDGEPLTLASDLRVDGPATLESLPRPAFSVRTDDGYEVRLHSRAARAGEEAELAFTVLRGGKPVEVQPYLGANGHLVALREGDLAFLHVHPTEGVRFQSTFPTTGRYRLFLQFKHAGHVHTAAFTEDVS
jgi:hypothetical protein